MLKINKNIKSIEVKGKLYIEAADSESSNDPRSVIGVRFYLSDNIVDDIYKLANDRETLWEMTLKPIKK
jgi:hypothetical protein